MRRPLGWIAVALIGATFTFHITGCSLIGLGAGAAYDATHKDVRAQVPARIVKLHPGDAMILELDDGTRVEGVYLRPGRISRRAYDKFYREWRENDPRAEGFPQIDERIMVGDVSSVVASGQGKFRGFGLEGVELEAKGRRVVPVTGSGWLVCSDGTRVGLDRVRQLGLERALPLSTTLEIRTNEEEVRSVLLNEVVLIHAPNHPQGARTGFAIGLAVDVVVVIVAIASSGPVNTNAYSGCSGASSGGALGW